jgi:hypothetical protein
MSAAHRHAHRAEKWAAPGPQVIRIDRDAQVLARAGAHAATEGLEIAYVQGFNLASGSWL